MKCVSLAEYLTGKLMVDPYYLLDEPPKFKKGQLPFDGNAGPENKTYSNIVYRKGVSNG
jgi:hypothetical protein